MKPVPLQEARLTGYEEFVTRVWPRKTLIRPTVALLFLSERVRRVNPDATGPVAIGARFTQEDLAVMVASTREAVGAAMGELRKRGS